MEHYITTETKLPLLYILSQNDTQVFYNNRLKIIVKPNSISTDKQQLPPKLRGKDQVRCFDLDASDIGQACPAPQPSVCRVRRSQNGHRAQGHGRGPVWRVHLAISSLTAPSG